MSEPCVSSGQVLFTIALTPHAHTATRIRARADTRAIADNSGMDTVSAAEILRNYAAGSDSLVAERVLPARAAAYADWPEWMSEAAARLFRDSGIARPWAHQVAAADALHAGKHVIVTTGTGSGKSLAAWAEFINRLYLQSQSARERTTYSLAGRKRRPVALYLAPTKALAADQVQALHRWCDDPLLRLRVGTADGDTDRDAKRWAADQADIIATNPDFLHHVILARAEHWARVLRGLELIVFDEVHFYRGVAAANIALVIRRLLRLARRYGANPQVVFLSATAADPCAVVTRYLGCAPTEVTAVTADSSPLGERTVILWQPALLPEAESDPIAALLDAPEAGGAGISGAEVDDPLLGDPLLDSPGLDDPLLDDSFLLQATPDAPQRYSATTEAAKLTTILVRANERLLTFVRSRAQTEAVAEMARSNLALAGPNLRDSVRAYRGGYLPQERRELEREMRSEKLRALVTTSALEVGIDIAGLDATISCGWPGTRASFWQQCGRAGRAGSSATNVLVAGDNPLDAYFLHHPQALFDTVETTVFSISNPYVLGPHLCSAAAEAPLTSSDLPLFGPNARSAIAELVEAGFLRERPDGWRWNVAQELAAHDLVDLRGTGTEVQIVNTSDGAVIGSVPSNRAQATVFPGARYVHQGRVYKVTELDTDVALVEAAKPQLRTRADIDTEIAILATDESRSYGEFTLACGTVRVTQIARSYDLLRLPGLQFAGEFPISLPPQSYETRAVWWTVSEDWLATQALTMDLVPGTLHAAEHAMIGILPLLATCDRWDLGGLSTAYHEQTEQPSVFVHDAAAGGAGISDFGFAQAAQWVEATWQAVAACDCENGCPRCIVSPKCGNGNRPLYKQGAISVLAGLLSAIRAGTD